jgi:hypothetical protein
MSSPAIGVGWTAKTYIGQPVVGAEIVDRVDVGDTKGREPEEQGGGLLVSVPSSFEMGAEA